MSPGSAGEFGLIEHLSRRLAKRPGTHLGIGDDAAILEPLTAPVISCDCLVEQVHFRRDWTTPRQLGLKSLAVNVSDMAAMGATPVAAFVTLALSPRDDIGFVEQLYDGLEAAANLYDLTIAGGDTSRSPHGLMIAITICGNAPHPVTRAGAAAGDLLLVTGSLGAAAAGLWCLGNPSAPVRADDRASLIHRQLEPAARIGEMQAALAVTDGVGAAIDLSDGLAGDAGHIAQRSGLTLEIDCLALPMDSATQSAAAVAGVEVLGWALSGGEDYELLLCVRPCAARAVAAAIAATGTAVTPIGRCVPAGVDPVVLIADDGVRTPAPGGFTHF